MNNKIIELMQVPEEERDSNWLKDGLQSAIYLELATLPPYLCAMWSIMNEADQIDDLSHPYGIINSIVLEEMEHMGLACNILTSIGGVPKIDKIGPYPGPLPGGVHPAFKVQLACLSKGFIEHVCMEIEKPEYKMAEDMTDQTYPTIGDFYNAILEEIKKLSPSSFTGQHQVTSSGRVIVTSILTQDDAINAINKIKKQGEGTSQSPQGENSGDELAHYFKFGEIRYEHTYVQKSNGTWDYVGAEIPFPAPEKIYQMAPVPEGGYVNPEQPVQQLLDAFNDKFAELLKNLQDAWAQGGRPSLRLMRELEPLATAIMEKKLPDRSDNRYGPNFVLKGQVE